MTNLNPIEKQIYETKTKLRGTNNDEYQIYVECAKSLGRKVKTYDEWLNS